MKTIIITLTVILLGAFRLGAQGLPVYDNTNFLSLAQQLLESAKQTSELLNTVELLKEQKENLEIVNNVVKDLRSVRDIQQNNERLFAILKNDLREILNSPYLRAEEVDRVSQAFNSVIENAIEDLEFIGQILSSDRLKMTDSERTSILKDRQERSKERVADLDLKTRRYQDIISFRKMQDRINNRETGY